MFIRKRAQSPIAIVSSFLYRRHRGLGLVEIAFVLIVMGVLGHVALSSWSSYKRWQRDQVTSDHQEKVLQALGGYMRFYGFLPMPDIKKPGDKGVGNEDIIGIPACFQGPCLESIGAYSGHIPFRQIQIDPTWSRDGYHRPMTYVMFNQLRKPLTPAFADDKEPWYMDTPVGPSIVLSAGILFLLSLTKKYR